ncbi:hypothetical protein J1N35_007521 [Gossypium stocksii]|uniref:Uncharacterized protein n=1 Tax=Gossypium stocksii TaxID=47602 RepID=A0A9D3W7L6_9ROSI|nr:hypothetical protein J1N35_007521 [Gossypium stocksii]
MSIFSLPAPPTMITLLPPSTMVNAVVDCRCPMMGVSFLTYRFCHLLQLEHFQLKLSIGNPFLVITSKTLKEKTKVTLISLSKPFNRQPTQIRLCNSTQRATTSMELQRVCKGRRFFLKEEHGEIKIQPDAELFPMACHISTKS